MQKKDELLNFVRENHSLAYLFIFKYLISFFLTWKNFI